MNAFLMIVFPAPAAGLLFVAVALMTLPVVWSPERDWVIWSLPRLCGLWGGAVFEIITNTNQGGIFLTSRFFFRDVSSDVIVMLLITSFAVLASFKKVGVNSAKLSDITTNPRLGTVLIISADKPA